MFNLPIITVVGCILGILIVALVAWPRLRDYLELCEFERVRALFFLRREWVEAKFVTLASKSGKPRGLLWSGCDFDDHIEFARERSTGQLHALAGVTISFEAIVGDDMEDNPNVGNLRAATAVFLFDGKDWTTEGRAIFNLSPAQAIEHFHRDLVTVDYPA